MFDEHAMGYVDLRTIGEAHLADGDEGAGLRILAIGEGEAAVEPSPTTSRDGRYPYARQLTVLIREYPSEETQAFWKFLQSGGLGEVLDKHGYVGSGGGTKRRFVPGATRSLKGQ